MITVELGSGCKFELYTWNNFPPQLDLLYTNRQADPWYDDSIEDVPMDKQTAQEIISIMEKYILAYDQFMGDKDEITNS